MREMCPYVNERFFLSEKVRSKAMKTILRQFAIFRSVQYDVV